MSHTSLPQASCSQVKSASVLRCLAGGSQATGGGLERPEAHLSAKGSGQVAISYSAKPARGHCQDGAVLPGKWQGQESVYTWTACQTRGCSGPATTLMLLLSTSAWPIHTGHRHDCSSLADQSGLTRRPAQNGCPQACKSISGMEDCNRLRAHVVMWHACQAVAVKCGAQSQL